MSKTTNWSEIKGRIKTKFAKLSDADVDRLDGHMDQLKAKVQKAYGYTEEKAKRECDSFNNSMKGLAV